MPKFERVGYERLELFLPRDLAKELIRVTRKQSTTAWVCALIARELGVQYDPPKRGPQPRARKPRKE